jgi:hypothetical protein
MMCADDTQDRGTRVVTNAQGENFSITNIADTPQKFYLLQ